MAPASLKRRDNAPPLIKGYLPVRLRFPSETAPGVDDETFFYVKEHQQQNNNNNNTLFVANGPVHPQVSTKRLLKSIFGRYGDVTRVTVIANPRRSNNDKGDAAAESALERWTTQFANPSYLPVRAVQEESGSSSMDDGKFAHVVFRSTKEMKQSLQTLTEIMTTSYTDDDKLPAVTVDTIELQTLSDASDFYQDDSTAKQPGGVLAIAARYRASCRRLDRAALLEECNNVVQAYEHAQDEEQRGKAAAAAAPDDDGFVTVTYGTTTAHKGALEATVTTERPAGDARGRRKKTARSRPKKKNKLGGADPLPDFYRFQTKEHRKRSLQDLRQRFEEDLAKVKKMKEERQYKPF